MKFEKLINNIKNLKFDKKNLEKDIKNIKIDSKKVEEGDIFIALKGTDFDGNNFINEAIENGARLVVSENDYEGEMFVKTDDARAFYALACKNYFDRACDKMKIIAITGTNGKTTISKCISDVLQCQGKRVGLIGTLGASYNGSNFVQTGFTTPDPYLLHYLFLAMKRNGCEYVVMEASAHAIFLKKLEGVKFDVGVLTNITEDHLDFFGDMQNYANAKLSLFTPKRVKNAIICTDDYLSRKNLSKIKSPHSTYGFSSRNDITIGTIKKSFDSTKFKCFTDKGNFDITTKLVGDYNIDNILATVGVCQKLGLNNKDIADGISKLEPPKGRFNVVKCGKSNVVIDFAHTPDGLKNVLKTAKDLSKAKVVVVFGCGGNRDKKKRKIMGQIASFYADDVIITSDNPRYENPEDIVDEIAKGADSNATKIVDRKEAIRYALEKYNNGETIIIAGKGAEDYQEVKGVKHPYSDFDEVENYSKKNCENE